MDLLYAPFELGEHTVRIGASVGIAVYPEDASELESLCVAADLRMYDAKNDSRNSSELESAKTARILAGIEPPARKGLQVVDQEAYSNQT
jgi:predicted signal transduction protein with EAL and GGDEF domain